MVSRLSVILVSSTLLAAPAFAQTSSSPAASGSSSAATSGNFVTEQMAGQWRASKLIGVNVYSNNNEKIGDINEILLDSHGMAKAAVIGVGGFLGIGEKNVAVPFDSLEWVNQDMRTAAGTNAPTNSISTAANVANGTANNVNSGANAVATTAGTSTAPVRTPEQTAAYNGYPNHAVLRMSKADLQNAPTFRWYADRDSARANGAYNPAPNAPATRQ